MEVIRDRDGNVIQRSRNLAGIRRYVSNIANPIKTLDISFSGDGGGILSILFDNGCSFRTNFACFGVLKDFVKRWRNVYGAPLSVNGDDCGKVCWENEYLQ